MNNNVSQNESASAQKKRKNKIFNVVDLFVLILIVALVSAIIYAFLPWSVVQNKINSHKVKIEYEIKLENIDADLQDTVKVGEAVLCAETKEILGTIKSAEFEDSKTLSYNNKNNSGEVISGTWVTNSEKCTAILFISVQADFREGIGYTVNGQRIAVGEQFEVKLPNFSGKGICTDLYKV